MPVPWRTNILQCLDKAANKIRHRSSILINIRTIKQISLNKSGSPSLPHSLNKI